MGEAREVMDGVTDAIMNGDLEALKAFYASDAIAETPDRGTIRGSDAIAAYHVEIGTAFPDARWEELHKHEIGGTAIDEGYFVGTNTGSLTAPDGEIVPATGKQVRVRGCDIATVENGVITSHRFYFDMLGFLEQLGLSGQPDE